MDLTDLNMSILERKVENLGLLIESQGNEIALYQERIKKLEAEKVALITWLRDGKTNSHEIAANHNSDEFKTAYFYKSEAFLATLNFINDQNKNNAKQE